MKRILLLIVAVIAIVCQGYAFIDSYTIDRDKLPEEAQNMLTEYFSESKSQHDKSRPTPA